MAVGKSQLFFMVYNNCCHNDRQVMPWSLLPEIFIPDKSVFFCGSEFFIYGGHIP